MYYRKRIILLDELNKIFTILELNQREDAICVKVKEKFDMAVYYKNELRYFDDADCFTFDGYQGGEIHFAVLKNKKVIATGSTEGNHLFNLFTQENRKTKDNNHSLSTPANENNTTKPESQHEKSEKDQSKKKLENNEKTPTPTKIDDIPSSSEPIMNEKKGNVHEFYCSIKPNLDEMLTCYPREERLCSLIDESSWVKVERNDGYYAVGLISNDGAPEYICYGVPGKESDTPPEHLKDYCAWIPTDDTGNGYWTVFQDAKTGIAIKKS